MTTNRLSEITATEALDLFQSRDLSPVELMNHIIEQSSHTEPHINAFCDQYFESALTQARQAEKRYITDSDTPSLLEGIPMAVKDDTSIKGKRTTTGSMLNRNHIDEHTNPSIERLTDAGAIIHARTTCPEFCWAWVCYSKLYGVTRNPWNTDYSCGGSSGGSAASLAAGSTILATGTDSAGSIRQPAAMCGVVGFKPPYGRNPQDATSSFDTYNHIGPLARSVADCALMQNITSGYHPLDHTTFPQELILPGQYDSLHGLKIAWSMDLDYYPVSNDVRCQTLQTVDALKDSGAVLEEIRTPWAAKAVELAGYYGDHINSPAFEDAIKNHPDDVCDYTPYFAEQNKSVTSAMLQQSLTASGVIWRDWFGPIMEHYDAFICPTTSVQEVPAEMKPWEQILVNGQSEYIHDTVITILFNMFSRCPVLAVPSGLTSTGMPTGIQIVGKPYDDSMVFRIGSNLESIRPWKRVATAL